MGTSKPTGKFARLRSTTCLGLVGLAGGLLILGGCLVFLLFRDLVDSMIKQQIPLRVGGQVTDSWLNPPVRPLLKLYFFNTTNPEGFLKGEKPFLVEMGPYTWEETWEKVGVSWGEDGTTVKYSIKKTFRFRRDLSIGGEDDLITLPNVPLFASMNQIRFAGKLVQQALGSMLGILKQEIFNSTTVRDIIWGYENPLIKLGNEVLPPDKKLPFNDFGFFVNKNNSEEGVYEARTGLQDVMKVGEIVSYQDKYKLEFWNTEDCNTIRGTDGTMFHPDVERNETLHIFNMNLCQSLPLVYQEDVQHHGINTYRFVPPADVFGTPAENPKNKCFCRDGNCAPSGLFNVSSCQFGSPIMLSWPHFFQADPALLQAVDGLNPQQQKHQFAIDLVPKMGIGMRATVRTQINLVMSEMEHVDQFEGVRDIIYPVLWFQDGIEELGDEETLSLLHMALHTPETARSIMYPTMFVLGSLLLLATALLLARSVAKSKGAVSDVQLAVKRSTTPPPDYEDAA